MTDALTASPDPTFAHVLLSLSFTATASATATVERSADGGVTWTAVRGSPLTLIGPAPSAGDRLAYVYDTEAPLNTALLYRATSNLGVVISTGPVAVTIADGISWLKDPARPWANVRISLCAKTVPEAACTPVPAEPAVFIVENGLGSETYAADAGLFPVLNRARPADVYARRKDAVTSWQVVSSTLTAMNTLNTFYAAGGPVFLQLDPDYGWPDRYYQPGDVDVARVSKILSRPMRLWSVPLTVIDSFPGAGQGVFEETWCLVDAQYGTYQQQTNTGLTWGQVVSGAAAPAPLTGYGSGIYGGPPVYGG